jgi:Zn-finger nucleic acid-binding protein
VLCPRCSHDLVDNVGALGEAACPQCHARFLDADAVATVFFETAGIERDELIALTSDAQRTLECPSCRTMMSAIDVRGHHVWLCTGCGSASLVEGALAALSEGRFAEPRAIEASIEDSAVAILSVREVGKEELLAAFKEASFRNPIDAAATGGQGHGLITERATRRDAASLIDALAKLGIDAEIADTKTLTLPKVVQWWQLSSTSRGLKGASGHKRHPQEAFVGWDEVQVVVVGNMKSTAMKVRTLEDEAGEPTMELCTASQRVRVSASTLALARSPGVTAETSFRKHIREVLAQAPPTCLLAGEATALRMNALARLRTYRQKSWQDLMVWARWLAARAIDVEL